MKLMSKKEEGSLAKWTYVDMGDGVKKCQNFVDVFYGWPFMLMINIT